MIEALGDGGVLLRLRMLLLSRLLVRRFTPEALQGAPTRLGLVVASSLIAITTASFALGIAMPRALQGQAAGPFFLPALVWSAPAATVGIYFYAALSLSAAMTYRGELSMLLLAPVSSRLVLLDRLLAVSGSFSVLLFCIGIPNLVGAGQALQAGALYYVTCVVVVLLLPIPAAALGLLTVTLLLRLVPPRHARTSAAIGGSILAAILYLSNDRFGGITAQLSARTWHPVPTIWLGEALGAAGKGDLPGAYVYLLGSAILAALLTFLAVDAAARLLASGSATFAEVRRSGSAESIGERALDLALVQPLSESVPWSALLRKEWLGLRRDPKLLAQLAYPIGLEGFTFWQTIGNPFSTHALTGRLYRLFAGTLYLSTSLTALFLLTILALPMISREGRSLFILSLSPLRARDIFLAKVAFCSFPVLVMVEGLLFSFGIRLLQLSPGQAIFVATVLALLVLALAFWMICVGVVWPRLGGDSSRRQIHGTAILVGPTTGVVICAVVGYLLARAYSDSPSSPYTPVFTALLIVAFTGAIIGAAAVAGPRLLENLLRGDKRPA